MSDTVAVKTKRKSKKEVAAAPPAEAPARQEGRFVVESLESNLKGRQSVELERCTAIVGANRSGKTSVLQSIELALYGAVAGKTQGAALMRLAADGAETLWSEAFLAGGGSMRTEVTGSRGSASKPERVAKGTTLAGLDAADSEGFAGTLSLLSQSPEALKTTLLNRFGSGLECKVPDYLNAEQKEIWARGVATFASPKAALTGMAGWLDAEKRAIAAEMRAGESFIQNESARLERLIDEGGFEHADQVTDERAAELLARQQAGAALVTKRQELEVLRSAYADLKQVLESFRETEPVEEQGEVPELRRLLAQDRAKAELLGELFEASKKRGCCALCLSGEPSDDLRKSVLARIERREKELAAAASSKTGLSKAAWTARLAELEQRVAVMKLRGQQLKAELEALGEEEPPDADSVNLFVQTLALKKSISATANEQRARNFALEGMKQLIAVAKEQAFDAVKELGARVRAVLSRYMPKGFQPTVIFDLDGKETCLWGIEDTDGTSRTLFEASGSEVATMTVALHLAFGGGRAPLLVDDDILGRLGSSNVKLFLETLGARVTAGDIPQVVVAWTRAEEIPEGWTIVDRGEP